MAKIGFTMQEYRHEFIVFRLKHRVSVDINDIYLGLEFSSQWRQCHLHVVTEVAVTATKQC